MAIIKCGECNNDVSDKATACPKCGAPVFKSGENIAADAKLNTVQETSKKFKLQSLLSVLTLIIGFVLAGTSEDPVYTSIAIFLIIMGMGWYIINRFRIWWHHK